MNRSYREMALHAGLCIEQRSECNQGIQGGLRAGRLTQTATDHWIEHPTRDRDPRVVLELYDECFVTFAA
jgi:hypothetical protein